MAHVSPSLTLFPLFPCLNSCLKFDPCTKSRTLSSLLTLIFGFAISAELTGCSKKHVLDYALPCSQPADFFLNTGSNPPHVTTELTSPDYNITSVGITQFISRISLLYSNGTWSSAWHHCCLGWMRGSRKTRRRKSRERHNKGNLTLRKVIQGGDGSVGKGACCQV